MIDIILLTIWFGNRWNAAIQILDLQMIFPVNQVFQGKGKVSKHGEWIIYAH